MRPGISTLAAGAMLLSALTALPALALATPATDAPGWQKICEKDSYCLLRRTVSDGKDTRGSFTIHYGDERLFIVPAVPAGLLLPAGLSLKLDDAEALDAPYTVCSPQACTATATIDEAYFTALRKGGELTMTGKALDGSAYVVRVDLAGITAAYRGEPDMSLEAFRKSGGQ